MPLDPEPTAPAEHRDVAAPGWTKATERGCAWSRKPKRGVGQDSGAGKGLRREGGAARDRARSFGGRASHRLWPRPQVGWEMPPRNLREQFHLSRTLTPTPFCHVSREADPWL